MPKKERRAIAEDALRRSASTTARITAYPTNCPRMRQRVMIAMAMLLEPQVMIM